MYIQIGCINHLNLSGNQQNWVEIQNNDDFAFLLDGDDSVQYQIDENILSFHQMMKKLAEGESFIISDSCENLNNIPDNYEYNKGFFTDEHVYTKP
ncbi:MAG: hypothetical protein KDC52_04310 [Ignavibacteriae bacterium]|nr:hypothetical protein [Ignavibacteriota bacterium]